jgi:hypothetical protein
LAEILSVRTHYEQIWSAKGRSINYIRFKVWNTAPKPIRFLKMCSLFASSFLREGSVPTWP